MDLEITLSRKTKNTLTVDLVTDSEICRKN